jgi:hypothetical protein
MGKIAEATTNKGGGKAGLEDRQGGKGGHAKFQCHIVSDAGYIYADAAPCTTPLPESFFFPILSVQDTSTLHQVNARSS